MSGELDAVLITAIEKRSKEALILALAAGASPNARKQVTLKVKIANDWRTETVGAETALALAVVYGRLDFVRTLIHAGADVESPVEWRIPNFETNWTSSTWDNSKWLLQYHFDSIIEVALGTGTLLTNFNDVETKFTEELSVNARFALNKDGGAVTVTNPSTLTSTCDFGKMTPDLAIIKLLLRHGARSTPACTARVRALDKAPLLRVLESQSAELAELARSDSLAERLVDAVEKRRLDLLKSALTAGASPNARKKVSLSVAVPGFGTRSETVFAESALALAVLYAQEGAVAALLEAGKWVLVREAVV
ncbi:hypothetical protein HDU93_000739 [Gonapodya sp. JEL0774]|nr:hypothetical protein HDU93_000739 [Gonapodya sp. JEL0774]